MTLPGFTVDGFGLSLIALVVLTVSWACVMWRVARGARQRGAGEEKGAVPADGRALADPAPLAAIARLIEEFETLRAEVQDLRDEIVDLRGQIVAPPASAQYSEAMALAQRGAQELGRALGGDQGEAHLDQIAEQCGISRGEAELVLALQQQKMKSY